MKTQNVNTGKYARKISKKASKIVKKAKSRRIRRLIFLGVILSVCLAGIFMGVSSKSKSIETQYQKFIEAPNQSALNNELLSYKDVCIIFDTSFLGNQSCQSLMGGFFYEGMDCSIYPSEAGKKMVLRSGDKEVTLCEGLTSDINVKDGVVFYRKLNSRSISSFTISTGKTTEVPIKNVGQFIICGDTLYYIDLTTSSLMAFDMVTSETEEVIHSEVSSFVVAGNNIIYLNSDHILYEMNLSNHTITTIGKNISEFAYNGKLWMQNNEKVYSKSLDKKAIKDCPFDIQCNRLLGIVEPQMFVESEDGIYVCNIATNTSRKIAEGTFIGASDESLLVYNSSNGSYQVIEIA
ncbi:MAG: DUF5050 domain-containing protein [Eubacteriales bacterium]|nr:DUF5050 domain-containing protein [Eubacteriales bacterium]